VGQSYLFERAGRWFEARAKTSADHPGPACPVGTTKCTSCHMPKIELPDFHHEFTDHRIRTVRKGDPFPQ